MKGFRLIETEIEPYFFETEKKKPEPKQQEHISQSVILWTLNLNIQVWILR